MYFGLDPLTSRKPTLFQIVSMLRILERRSDTIPPRVMPGITAHNSARSVTTGGGRPSPQSRTAESSRWAILLTTHNLMVRFRYSMSVTRAPAKCWLSARQHGLDAALWACGYRCFLHCLSELFHRGESSGGTR